MSTKKMESVFNIVLLALQICLGVWQFAKLTPVGALIQGVMGYVMGCVMGWLMVWLPRPFRLSSTYVRLQCCNGRVFKKVNSYVLQADIPSGRPGIHGDGVNKIELNYLGEESCLERIDNKLFVNGKMCYYITDRIWQELQTMRDVLPRELAANSYAARAIATTRAAAAAAAAIARAADASADATAARRAAAQRAVAYAAARRAVAYAAAHGASEAAEATREAGAAARVAGSAARVAEAAASEAEAAASVAKDAASEAETAAHEAAHYAEAARDAARNADADAALYPVFIKSRKDFWEEVIIGGMMTLDEVLDGVILDNQCVSLPLNNQWLLPVNVLVSEEKLLKVLNLFALFLQTKMVKVNRFIPTTLSILSALLEFSTTSRVWLYTCINVGFCYIVHFIFDPFPRSWRRQVYSLGQWVENLKPCNDIELTVARRNITAIITVGAKIDKEGATSVPWLDVANGENEKHFCKPIDGDILCKYVRGYQICEISAPTFSDVYVECKSMDDFEHIVTLVSCIAKNWCGSLRSYGPKNKVWFPGFKESQVCVRGFKESQVCVRGFKESLISYVKNGLPTIYQLELENVVVA